MKFRFDDDNYMTSTRDRAATQEALLLSQKSETVPNALGAILGLQSRERATGSDMPAPQQHEYSKTVLEPFRRTPLL